MEMSVVASISRYIMASISRYILASISRYILYKSWRRRKVPWPCKMYRKEVQSNEYSAMVVVGRKGNCDSKHSRC